MREEGRGRGRGRGQGWGTGGDDGGDRLILEFKTNNKSYHATLHIRTYACVLSLFPNSFNSRPLHSEKKNDSSYPSYEYVRYMRIMCTLGMYVVRKVCITLTFEMYVCFFELSFQRERESTWWSVVSFSKLLFNPGCTIVQCLRNEIAGVLLKWMLLLVSKWISHFCKTIWPRASPLLMLNWWVDSSKQTHACKPVRRLCCFCSAPL